MLPSARQEKLLVQEVGEELVIYDQESHRAHRLSRTAAMVWRHCDGQTSVSRLTDAVAVELDQAVPNEVVSLALDQLGKARLLEKPAQAAGSVSRRQALRRFKAMGGLALILPVVASISAPGPLIAQYRCMGECLDPDDCARLGGRSAGQLDCPQGKTCCTGIPA